jgi:hypothetical protein
MKISKFAKVDRDVLLEYVYNDGNLLSEKYKILSNVKDNVSSFLSGDASATGNIKSNQLFKIDAVANKFGKVNTSYYSFLKDSDYSAGIPVRYDTIKLHLPINYTFGEHIGAYIKVYTYGYDNKTLYEISNFYFDISDVNQSYLLNYTSPPLFFQEKLWGKNLTIEIPAVNQVSNQRVNGVVKNNSINSNLTGGIGLSLTSPIFIDFYFINKSQVLNSVTTYLMSSKVTVTVPQTPEFEQLGLRIDHSVNGDFFEIYGTYNDTIAELKLFLDNSVALGNRYYIEYTITLYEQNIKGKSMKVLVSDNFNEKIEYRPIIKYSTTTAIIDVEMRLIDAVDDSYIVRMASYGMLQDEVSKYSLNLSKINLRNANKPKIYNTRSGSGFGDANSGLGLGMGNGMGNNINVSTIKVPFPVMIDRSYIIGKSDNVIFQKNKYYGIGKLLINVFPFDNIINFVIAIDFTETGTETSSQIQYLDMSGMNDIKMEFKNPAIDVNVPIYRDAENSLEIGQVVFKIPKNKIPDIRKIYESGINVFYITTTTDDVTTVIYTGLYKMYDSASNINDLNQNVPTLSTVSNNPIIIDDPNTKKETAIVTRKKVLSSDTPNALKKGG